MSRGYGNAARYERQALAVATNAGQVRAASVAAVTEEAIAAVESGIPAGLADTLADLEGRIAALE